MYTSWKLSTFFPLKDEIVDKNKHDIFYDFNRGECKVDVSEKLHADMLYEYTIIWQQTKSHMIINLLRTQDIL